MILVRADLTLLVQDGFPVDTKKKVSTLKSHDCKCMTFYLKQLSMLCFRQVFFGGVGGGGEAGE